MASISIRTQIHEVNRMLPPSWFYGFVAVFVVITAAALCLQFVMLAGMYLVGTRLQQKVEGVLTEVRPVMEDAKTIIRDTRAYIEEFSGAIREFQLSARERIADADEVVKDITQRAHLEAMRADALVARTIGHAERAVQAVEDSVTWPARKARAVGRGIRVAVRMILRLPRRRRIEMVEPVIVIEERETIEPPRRAA